jgi:UDP-N-acetylmuramoyl-tripeptide--D-alanyl-D-alanine ligase
MGVAEETVYESLTRATGPDWRLQLQKSGNVSILNDAYNANPNSMRAALETVRDLQTTGRRLAILGDMRELGESTDRYHQEIGEFAATCNLDGLYCVGPKSAIIAAAARAAGMIASKVLYFPDAASCAAATPQKLRSGDLILLKASRSVRLENVALAIQSRPTPKSKTRPIRKAI